MQVNATLHNNWQSPPSLLSLNPIVATSCAQASLQIKANTGYTISIPVSPSGSLSCEFHFSLNNLVINSSIADTTQIINEWLAEVAPPPASLQTDDIIRMYYNSWFNFWYNTEHAEGFWIDNVITPSKTTYGR